MTKVGKNRRFYFSVLWKAVKFNQVKIVETLLGNGFNVNEECGRHRETVLHLAAESGLLIILKLLLENGADVKKRDRYGNTPLHKCGKFKWISLELLKYNSDVNTRNALGETPLHHAKSCSVINSLIAKGADLEAEDCNGETALSKAIKRKCTSVQKALIEGGAKTMNPDIHRKTATLSSCFIKVKGRWKCVNSAKFTVFPPVRKDHEFKPFEFKGSSYSKILSSVEISHCPNTKSSLPCKLSRANKNNYLHQGEGTQSFLDISCYEDCEELSDFSELDYSWWEEFKKVKEFGLLNEGDDEILWSISQQNKAGAWIKSKRTKMLRESAGITTEGRKQKKQAPKTMVRRKQKYKFDECGVTDNPSSIYCCPKWKRHMINIEVQESYETSYFAKEDALEELYWPVTPIEFDSEYFDSISRGEYECDCCECYMWPSDLREISQWFCLRRNKKRFRSPPQHKRDWRRKIRKNVVGSYY